MSRLASRTAQLSRRTRETAIELRLCLDGTGASSINTGIGFYDHLLTALAFHARFDLTLTCEGDLIVDDHHTVEDCALAIGSAFNESLGSRVGIRRFGSAFAPLDESLARAVVDCSGRPFARTALQLQREHIGTMSCENIVHVIHSFASAAAITIHLDVLHGMNDHHRAEAAFKALAFALRDAVTHTHEMQVPSTKGVL